MIKRDLMVLLLIAFGVTAPLAYLASQPTYIAEILVLSGEARGERRSPTPVITRVDGNGIAIFDFRAHVEDTRLQSVFLEIRPQAEAIYRRQSEGYAVTSGLAHGIAELGSATWPLRQDEWYTFRLVDEAGGVRSEGIILAKVQPIAGGSPLSILLIGLFASVLQIAVVVWPRPRPRVGLVKTAVHGMTHH